MEIMETKEFKIQVPEGYEIDREKSTFENIVFKKVENELPKSWEDLYEVGGWFVDFQSKVVTSGSMRTADSVKNRFPTKEEAEACLALAQLCQLRDRYNEGWKPNWNNETDKYTIIYGSNKIDTSFSVYTQRILSFKTVGIRDKFLENFRGLIETAKPLL
jgi:hypothetical protein